MIRALVERLPVLLTPRWVWTRAQPIAVEDVVAYLVEALDLESRGSKVFEIGGADVATYGELMREYARQRGLRRLLVRVPVLTPRLSSLWLGLVTPVYARVGRKLIESLPNETIVRDRSADERFGVRPRGYREAIARSLANEDRELAETLWSDALSAGEGGERESAGRPRGRLIDSRTVEVPVPPARAFAPIRRIGGKAGWYYGNTLWQLRGFLDLLAGCVGLRRGRRDPDADRRLAAGLLARGGLRARPAAAPAGGDAPTRPRLAAVRGRRRRTEVADPPDRDLRPRRARRARLLVRPAAAARTRLPGDARRDRAAKSSRSADVSWSTSSVVSAPPWKA